jgi:hypothetical protein
VRRAHGQVCVEDDLHVEATLRGQLRQCLVPLVLRGGDVPLNHRTPRLSPYSHQPGTWELGYHQIDVDFTKPGRSKSFDPGAKTSQDDTSTVYNQTLYGQFYASQMDSSVWAHEIGHLMGLGDDYYNLSPGHRQDEPLPGRAGTLMADGATIDQPLADRLADILNLTGHLPQCWKGTMHSETTGHQGGSLLCTGEAWDHAVKLFASAEGKVTGEATSHLVSMPTCSGGDWASVLRDHAKNAAFGAAGRRNEQLTNATTAHGDVRTNVAVPFSVGASASGHHIVDLTCVSCILTPRGL